MSELPLFETASVNAVHSVPIILFGETLFIRAMVHNRVWVVQALFSFSPQSVLHSGFSSHEQFSAISGET